MIKNIYIDGFPLENAPTSYIKEVKGLTGPAIDLATFNRGGNDGTVLGTPFYRGRVFTIILTVLAYTPGELLAQKDRLMTAIRLPHYGDNKYRLVEFETANGDIRSCQAVTSDMSMTEPLESANSYAMTPLTFQMTADRWYLEGQEHQADILVPNFGGMAVPMDVPMSMAHSPKSNINQFVNNGNTESSPVFRINGPLTAFDIYNSTTGQRMSVTYTLASSSEYIELDTYAHSAFANSVTNIRGAVSGDWIEIAPGINQLGFSATSSSSGANAQVTYKDAFLGI